MTSLRLLWAGPLTLIGLTLAGIARMTGGAVGRRDGIVEAHGGALARILPRLGIGMRPAAMALGHVVVACDADTLERTRAHERIHVQQAERWGPLFPIAYGVAALVAWWQGGDGYRDNVFEREARNGEW
jgi:hypothetical protein